MSYVKVLGSEFFLSWTQGPRPNFTINRKKLKTSNLCSEPSKEGCNIIHISPLSIQKRKKILTGLLIDYSREQQTITCGPIGDFYKVLLEHDHMDLFLYYQCLLSHYNHRVELVVTETFWLEKDKICIILYR